MTMFLPFLNKSIVSLFLISILFFNLFNSRNFQSMFFKSQFLSFFINKEFNSSILQMSPKGEMVSIFSLFFLILNFNLMSLFPNIFAFSSQLYINLFISMSVFISIMMWGGSQNVNIITSHISPKGSPLILLSILVLIESFSWMIRPFTLSIRLSANMLAGHILLSLVSSLMMKGIVVLLLFYYLEIFVAFIQAYVFCLLLLSYKLDVSI